MWAQFATRSTPAPEVRGQRGRGAAQPERPGSNRLFRMWSAGEGVTGPVAGVVSLR
jgi:hypothetical protein